MLRLLRHLIQYKESPHASSGTIHIIANLGYPRVVSCLAILTRSGSTMYTKLPSYTKADNLDDTFVSAPPTPTSPKNPLNAANLMGQYPHDVEMGLYLPLRIELGKPEPMLTPRRDYAFWIFLCAILCIFAVACATVLHITASQLNQFQQLRTMELYRNVNPLNIMS